MGKYETGMNMGFLKTEGKPRPKVCLLSKIVNIKLKIANYKTNVIAFYQNGNILSYNEYAVSEIWVDFTVIAEKCHILSTCDNNYITDKT